jgi:FAD/FMN-containing dehydrogenase
MATSATAQARYRESVRQLQQQYQAVPVGQPVRLAKRTSNVFRTRTGSPSALDVSEFSGVLAIDEERRTADVLGMTTYEQLVAATLPRGLMPLVVPELKTITIGGAVTGLGIESSSFRNGCPHESVLEMDVLVGDGRIVTAAPDGPHADLFFGFPNSYGTLGYALRLRIELEPVRPFVALRHSRFGETSQYFAALAEVVAARVLDGEPVDFVDGVFFGPDEMYLTTGRFVDDAPHVSDYGGRQIYYRSLQQRTRDFLTVNDYLWRWDTDWFWCSRALGVQHPLVRPLVPRSVKRSDRYSSVVGFERRHNLVGRFQGMLGRSEREVVVQDVEVPVDRAAQFIDSFTREVGISPVWICPLRQRDATRTWELYVLDPATTYVNFGFWSSVERRAGERDGDRNRMIERLVSDLGGRKSLYSTSFYDRDEFWATYNGPTYQVLKKEYDADGRLLDLYDKCVRAR